MFTANVYKKFKTSNIKVKNNKYINLKQPTHLNIFI